MKPAGAERLVPEQALGTTTSSLFRRGHVMPSLTKARLEARFAAVPAALAMPLACTGLQPVEKPLDSAE